MDLETYLTTHGIAKSDFAKEIGIRPESFSRYLNGERRPRWRIIQKIKAATGGAVDANSFLDIGRAA